MSIYNMTVVQISVHNNSISIIMLPITFYYYVTNYIKIFLRSELYVTQKYLFKTSDIATFHYLTQESTDY